ncbi:MAG: formate dehydrogenase accessory sulfurtransferase FdhD [Rubellimicrobium sp.]|nr:formate dehydrogenase accessory sulfurtransferase FdhD [Rubellimicrobium sp.]
MSAHRPVLRVETPAGPRDLPEEVAVALVYNGTTQAVMMATPADIADFALGFTISEGIAPAAEAGEIEIVTHDLGIEARLWLPPAREAALASRRRALVGAVGCGLCGIDSLEAAVRALPRLPAPRAPLPGPDALAAALALLPGHQPLHDATRAVHAAALWRDGAILLAREDVGRHNALDKLIGATARAGIDPAGCAVLVTSRLSVEMVQKAVMARAPVLASVSLPTAHARRLAQAAGLMLFSTAGGRPVVYAHPQHSRQEGPST